MLRALPDGRSRRPISGWILLQMTPRSREPEPLSPPRSRALRRLPRSHRVRSCLPGTSRPIPAPAPAHQDAQATREDRRGHLKPARRARLLHHPAHPAPDSQPVTKRTPRRPGPASPAGRTKAARSPICCAATCAPAPRFPLARRGAVKIIPVKEVSSFADGEVIDVPGSPRALHTPGHTPAAPPSRWKSAMRSWQVMPCAPGIPTPAGSARRSCHPRCT